MGVGAVPAAWRETMIQSQIFTLFVFFCVISNAALAEYKVGDMVVVVHDAKMKVGDKVIEEIPRGVGVKVQAVKGDWLWVSSEAVGWVNQRDVATPTRAIEIFTDEIKKDHGDSDAYVRRGLAWFDKQEADIAISDLNQAIRLDPRNASAYSSRAICWWSKREVDKAIADCTDAIRLDPQEPMYLANRGILWNMKGEHQKAIADADAALRVAPKFVTAHLVRGNALVREHQNAKARAEFDEALRINSHDATAYALRARTLAEDGEYSRAVQDFDRAVALDPKDKNVCNEFARFYATCPDAGFRNGPKAVEYARRACELSDWKWASSISVLAAAYAEQGNYEQAVAWQEKATAMVEGKRRDDFEARLALFKAHKPFRQERPKVSRTGRKEISRNAVN